MTGGILAQDKEAVMVRCHSCGKILTNGEVALCDDCRETNAIIIVFALLGVSVIATFLYII